MRSRRQPCTPPMHLPRPGLNVTIQPAPTPAGSPRAIPVLTSTNRCDIAMTKIDTRFPVLVGLGLLLASGLVGQQNQLAGSVPTGTASSTPLALTLRDAIERGLRTNLQTLTSATASEIARGLRQRAMSALLPEVHGQISEIDQQLNLKTFGLNFPGIPPIAGPFHYTDLRAYASMSVFDYGARKTYKSAPERRPPAHPPILGAG